MEKEIRKRVSGGAERDFLVNATRLSQQRGTYVMTELEDKPPPISDETYGDDPHET